MRGAVVRLRRRANRRTPTFCASAGHTGRTPRPLSPPGGRHCLRTGRGFRHASFSSAIACPPALIEQLCGQPLPRLVADNVPVLPSTDRPRGGGGEKNKGEISARSSSTGGGWTSPIGGRSRPCQRHAATARPSSWSGRVAFPARSASGWPVPLLTSTAGRPGPRHLVHAAARRDRLRSLTLASKLLVTLWPALTSQRCPASVLRRAALARLSRPRQSCSRSRLSFIRKKKVVNFRRPLPFIHARA